MGLSQAEGVGHTLEEESIRGRPCELRKGVFCCERAPVSTGSTAWRAGSLFGAPGRRRQVMAKTCPWPWKAEREAPAPAMGTSRRQQFAGRRPNELAFAKSAHERGGGLHPPARRMFRCRQAPEAALKKRRSLSEKLPAREDGVLKLGTGRNWTRRERARRPAGSPLVEPPPPP